MTLLPQLIVLAAAFVLMQGLVRLIPHVFAIYRQRYQISLGQTTRELNKLFFRIKPSYILIGAALLGSLIGYLTDSWVTAAVLCLLGLFAPKIMLALWKSVRSAQFEAQLMDALILLGNTLKSGLDMTAGIERISSDMTPPISEEFGLVLNAYRLGTPLEQALLDLTERIDSRTLETVIYAVNIQRETGGNIIKTFDQLVSTIREENKLQKKVRAITAQGRTQILFLALFPWALAFLFFLMAPDMMKPALANPWGQMAFFFLIFWEVIGILVTKKIVSVDV